MIKESRTVKTIRNTKYSLLYKLIDVLLAFVLRTIFIKCLSISYLGIQGLFSNILSVLSLFEAGVGAAIVFALYEPLAKNDNKKIASLMQLFKKVYTSIGILILVFGISLTPALKFIIHLPETIEHLYVIYWLTIANTSMTYFLAYRRSLLIADQRSDINIKNQMLFRFTRFLLLALVLLLTRNFILYLIIEILNTLLSNLHISYIVKKRYTYIEKEKASPLEKSEKEDLLRYMTAGIFSKIGQTVVTSTDSLIISAFISTILVGYYSNYNLIYTNIDIFIYVLFSSVTAAVGNFAVEKSKEQSKQLFDKLYFINYVIVGLVAICMMCLSTPFVKLWLGEEYVLSEITVSIIVLNFYITSMCNATGNFLSSQGYLSYKNRFRPLVEAVTNLICSILFVTVFDLGITGVFMGTTVCFLCGRMWMDTYTLYRFWFDISYKEFIMKYVKQFLLVSVLSLICKTLTQMIFHWFSVTIWSWIICGIICCGIFGLVITIIYRKTEEFRYAINTVKKILR